MQLEGKSGKTLYARCSFITCEWAESWDKLQLYIRKLRETPKAYSTAVMRKLITQQMR